MATYYIEDKNGEYASIDGRRKFKKLSGQKARDYLKTPEGKKKRFMATDASQDGEKNVFVELKQQDIKDYRKEERREQYRKKCCTQSGYIAVPLYSCIEANDESGFPCEEIIEDGQVEIEQDYVRKEEIETLRNAINCLKPNERNLILAFFFRSKIPTEKEYGDEIGISQQAVHKKKERILLKLKKFFEFGCYFEKKCGIQK